MYLLDTNVCIQFLRDADSAIARRLATVPRTEVTLCAVVKAELHYGAQRSADPDRSMQVLEGFFAHFTSLPFDDRAAEFYGRVRAYLARQGTLIGANGIQLRWT